jgi:hypothetical protein
MSFTPPVKQSRLTIAFRLILAIPHLFVLWALGIATEVIVVIGWFAALFTGRLPEWAHTFVTGTVRWQARVYSYLYFLTDSYPPFSLDDEPYPVRFVTMRTRLNRFAVLFRIVLLIPAAIVLTLASYGLAVLAFFVWLIALVAGRLPSSLHQALAAIIRFQIRSSAYIFMLTGVYPWWGLFGDGAPDTGTAGTAAAATTDSATADTVASAADAETGALRAPADPWRLPLSGAAKALVWVFLALGAAAVVPAAIVGPSSPSGNNPVSAFSNTRGLIRVGQAYDTLAASATRFESAVQACSQLSCVTALDRKEAGDLRTFAASVRSAGLVGQPATDASRLAGDASDAATSLDHLATDTSVSKYESDYAASPLQRQLNALDSDYTALRLSLTS